MSIRTLSDFTASQKSYVVTPQKNINFEHTYELADYAGGSIAPELEEYGGQPIRLMNIGGGDLVYVHGSDTESVTGNLLSGEGAAYRIPSDPSGNGLLIIVPENTTGQLKVLVL